MSKTWECGVCGRNNPPHRRICQTWNCEREPKKMVDTRIVDVDASPTLLHDRDAVDVESHVVGISNSRGRAVASLSLRRVPSQMQWRRRPRSSMQSSDRMQSMSDDGKRPRRGAIAAPTPVAAGDEDVYEILQAKQGKRKLVQAQLSALGPLKTRPRATQEAHDKANKKYKALGGGVREGSALRQAAGERGGRRRRQRSDFFGQSRDSNHIRTGERGLEILTAVQWRQKLGLMDFRSDRAFLREVAAMQIDEGIVQEWNSYVWADETDSIEELIFHTVLPRSSLRRGRAVLRELDGVSSCLGSNTMALTDVSWEQRVLRARWSVSFRPPRHLQQRLSLPQQQSDSCSKR